jgi:hypothetical protein
MVAVPGNPLLTLLELGQRARAAASADELAFLAVNDSRSLLAYRQAVLWFAEGGVRAVSGIVQVERHTPYVHYLCALCKALSAGDLPAATPRVVVAADIGDELGAEWSQWLPAQVLWIPLSDRGESQSLGGLLLAGDEVWDESLLVLAAEWGGVWHHAWCALFRPAPWSPGRLRAQLGEWWFRLTQPDLPWWRRRRERVLLAILAVLCFPVRLSVLAPGELVPANPAVIRAPLDGVIGQIHVRPNQTVKAGDLLFSFDEAPIAARLEVARQALSTAEAEYRQMAQMALSESKFKGQLALLLGKIAEKRAEAEFLGTQFERAHIAAPQDGVAMFDDPTEWIGRPVKTGERVMRVAVPADAEIEAWIPIGDAIPLPENATVSLYLAASPFFAVDGEVRYLGHDAMPRPEGAYAYRLRATLIHGSDHRIGSKGTVKVRGGWVPLAYWVLRRPLAVLRQFLAV